MPQETACRDKSVNGKLAAAQERLRQVFDHSSAPLMECMQPG
jgi:hypothetical protein